MGGPLHGGRRTLITASFRRVAREAALRALYMVDTGEATVKSALEVSMTALEDEEYGKQWSGGYKYLDLARDLIEKYAEELARGTWQERRELDYHISRATPDFDLGRLSIIDLNILRLALYELEFVPYIAPAVSIDQALEIAKRYSTIESPRFINGVLATLVSQTAKAHWDIETAPEDPAKTQMERLNELVKARKAADLRRRQLEAEAVAKAAEEEDDGFPPEPEEATIGGWRLRSQFDEEPEEEEAVEDAEVPSSDEEESEDEFESEDALQEEDFEEDDLDEDEWDDEEHPDDLNHPSPEEPVNAPEPEPEPEPEQEPEQAKADEESPLAP